MIETIPVQYVPDWLESVNIKNLYISDATTPGSNLTLALIDMTSSRYIKFEPVHISLEDFLEQMGNGKNIYAFPNVKTLSVSLLNLCTLESAVYKLSYLKSNPGFIKKHKSLQKRADFISKMPTVPKRSMLEGWMSCILSEVYT